MKRERNCMLIFSIQFTIQYGLSSSKQSAWLEIDWNVSVQLSTNMTARERSTSSFTSRRIDLRCDRAEVKNCIAIRIEKCSEILIYHHLELIASVSVNSEPDEHPLPHKRENQFINRLQPSNEVNVNLIDLNRWESWNRTCRDDTAYIRARNDSKLKSIHDTQSIKIYDEEWHHSYRRGSFR